MNTPCLWAQGLSTCLGLLHALESSTGLIPIQGFSLGPFQTLGTREWGGRGPPSYREQERHPGGSRHGHAPWPLGFLGSCRRGPCGGGPSGTGVRLPFLLAALQGVHQRLVIGPRLGPVLSRTVGSSFHLGGCGPHSCPQKVLVGPCRGSSGWDRPVGPFYAGANGGGTPFGNPSPSTSPSFPVGPKMKPPQLPGRQPGRLCLAADQLSKGSEGTSVWRPCPPPRV